MPDESKNDERMIEDLMGLQPPPTTPTVPEAEMAVDGEAVRALLSHVDRMWRAEEQNSSRLAAKANLALPVLTFTLGFKLLAISREVESIARIGDTWPATLYWIFTVLSILLLTIALLFLLKPRLWAPGTFSAVTPEKTPESSSVLLLPEARIRRNPLCLSERQAVLFVWESTVLAVTDLTNRNARRASDIHKAQALLVWALGGILVSMVFWVIALAQGNSVVATT